MVGIFHKNEGEEYCVSSRKWVGFSENQGYTLFFFTWSFLEVSWRWWAREFPGLLTISSLGHYWFGGPEFPTEPKTVPLPVAFVLAKWTGCCGTSDEPGALSFRVSPLVAFETSPGLRRLAASWAPPSSEALNRGPRAGKP